jgi:hypothetical protein
MHASYAACDTSLTVKHRDVENQHIGTELPSSYQNVTCKNVAEVHFQHLHSRFVWHVRAVPWPPTVHHAHSGAS